MSAYSWVAEYGAPMVWDEDIEAVALLLRRLYATSELEGGTHLHAAVEAFNLDDESLEPEIDRSVTWTDYTGASPVERLHSPEVLDLCEEILRRLRELLPAHRAAALGWALGYAREWQAFLNKRTWKI